MYGLEKYQVVQKQKTFMGNKANELVQSSNMIVTDNQRSVVLQQTIFLIFLIWRAATIRSNPAVVCTSFGCIIMFINEKKRERTITE